MKAWLDKGVDALRIDTVKHMPLWFWQEFTSDMVSHKPDLFMFGEWIYNHPGNEESVEFANNSGMSVLDFGLCVAIRSALASGDPRGFLAIAEIFDLDCKYRNATDLVTFIENHDMPRFQSLGANEEMLHLATILILLCRGIPCLYYGTEQYLHDDTNGGADPYNRPMMSSFATDTPVFKIVQKLSALRRANASVQFGSQWTQYVTPEVFCFSRRYREARCFVALNRGAATTLEKVGTDLPDGTYTCLLTGRQLAVAAGRIAGLALAEHEALVLEVSDVPASGKGLVRFQVNDCPTRPGDVVAVIGNVEELGCWDVSRAYRLEFLNGKTWHGGIAFEESAGRQVTYKYVVLNERDPSALPLRENRTTRRRIVPAAGFAKWRDIWEE
jgi:cyclomaltodextrin glucanotransferase